MNMEAKETLEYRTAFMESVEAMERLWKVEKMYLKMKDVFEEVIVIVADVTSSSDKPDEAIIKEWRERAGLL